MFCFTFSLGYEHWNCCHFLVIKKNGAMNITIQVFFSFHFFLVKHPRVEWMLCMVGLSCALPEPISVFFKVAVSP